MNWNKGKHVNEFKKLKRFDSSYFRGRNHFLGDDGTQHY